MLVFPVSEEMDTVPHDWASNRPAELLILVGDHSLLNEVGRVPLIVAEVTRKCPGYSIRAGLGDGIHHHTHRASLGGVESVRREHELGNRIAAVARLVLRTTHRQRRLLAVDLDLKESLPIQRNFARGVL